MAATEQREAPRSIRLRPSTWAELQRRRAAAGETVDETLRRLMDQDTTSPRARGVAGKQQRKGSR